VLGQAAAKRALTVAAAGHHNPLMMGPPVTGLFWVMAMALRKEETMFRSATLVGLSLVLTWLQYAPPTACAAVVLSQDFDSGCLDVARSSIDTTNPSAPQIVLEPRRTWKGTNEWWWMYFGVSGVQGTTPQFHHEALYWMNTRQRYVYSYDQVNWAFLDNTTISGGQLHFSLSTPFTQDTVYIAVGIPYPLSRTEAFVASVRSSPFIHPTASADANLVIGRTLGTAAGGYLDDLGRSVPAQNLYGFCITDPNTGGHKLKIAMQAGNHSGETTTCYALEGMVNFLIGDDPRAAQLRRAAEFYVYPQVDPEGRYVGFYRSTPAQPDVNHNRAWWDPNGLVEIEIVEAAERADTGMGVDYFLDFHSEVQPDQSELDAETDMFNSAYAAALARRDPTILVFEYNWDLGYAQTWAKQPEGLSARYSGTVEFGFLANQPIERYWQYGQSYALAFYDVLVDANSNRAPTASAGPDQSIRLPVSSVALAGTLSDDGLPVGSTLACNWSQVSGPLGVVFADANALRTTATFPTLGTYVLRLTASDTALSGSDDCQVTVQPQSTLLMALHLPFDEGTGTTAYDTSSNGRNGTLTNGPAWIAGKVGNAVHFDEVNDYVSVPGFALNNEFTLAFWFVDKSVDDPTFRYMFSWGTVATFNSINVWIYESSGVSSAWLRTDIEDLNGPMREDYDDIKDATVADGQWHHYCATVANGAGLTVYLDGQPRVTDATVGGSSIAPTGNITIGGRNDLNSDRFFGGKIDDVRIYNQALTSSDVLAIFTGPVNVAPTANAGPDSTVMMPNALSLAGSISDDGRPNPPGTCTAAWSKVSGPGTVTFANPASASTTATFSTAGTYVLQLTASDSVLVGTSNVTVTALGPGDFNGDGRVDGVDFLIWQSHYPRSSGGTPDGGDANGDGKVDGVDFLIWQSHYHG
jgi:hypothetical protein